MISQFREVVTKVCLSLVPTIDSKGGARGVMVIVVGNGHGDTSSNLERD